MKGKSFAIRFTIAKNHQDHRSRYWLPGDPKQKQEVKIEEAGKVIQYRVGGSALDSLKRIAYLS